MKAIVATIINTIISLNVNFNKSNTNTSQTFILLTPPLQIVLINNDD